LSECHRPWSGPKASGFFRLSRSPKETNIQGQKVTSHVQCGANDEGVGDVPRAQKVKAGNTKEHYLVIFGDLLRAQRGVLFDYVQLFMQGGMALEYAPIILLL
jgi:hypothetical protein